MDTFCNICWLAEGLCAGPRSDSQTSIVDADALMSQASPLGDDCARRSHPARRGVGAEAQEAPKHQIVARPTVQLQVRTITLIACTYL